MVRVRSLQRASSPHKLFCEPSPASFHSRRVAAHVTDNGGVCDTYLASGVHVYCVKMEIIENKIDGGKEGLLVPADAQVAGAWQLEQCPHRAEIQSISLSASSSDGGLLLGSVDSYGRLVVATLDSNSEGASYTAIPQDAGVGEGWWAGIAFSPSQPTLAAVARGMAKCIDLYDKDIHVRTLRTLQHPTALAFLRGPGFSDSPSPILAVTEGPKLSIWDLRAGERGGCVQRLLGAFAGDPLYAVCSSSEGLVATGGAERTIAVFDPLKWTARARWTGCLKYEVTGLAFSSVDPSFIYVNGIDYEVVCGPWNRENTGGSNTQAFAFRGDSRWLGVDKCWNSDVLAGWCESGTIFLSHAGEDMDLC